MRSLHVLLPLWWSFVHRANGRIQRQRGHAFLQQHKAIQDQACEFWAASHEHFPGLPASAEGVHASQRNVIWQRGEVMVVGKMLQIGNGKLLGLLQQRYLVFHLPDGSCHEQAEQVCMVSTEERQQHSNGPSLVSSSEGASRVDCTSCVVPADAVPPLGYIRSMLGGALSSLANAGSLSSADRFLSIGLGSGALALWAGRNFPSVTVDAVDLSADVVAAAHCFGVGNSTISLHVADGRKFLDRQPEGTYDAIFIDAFDDRRTIPQCLSTVEFFELVAKKLKPASGVLSLNVAGGSNVQDLLASVQATFVHVSLGSAEGETNVVILASQTEVKPWSVRSLSSPTAQSLTSWVNDAGFIVADRISTRASRDADILGGCAA